MELKMFNIVIHAGYAKAASSTLQRYLFNEHPGINNLSIFPIQNIGLSGESDEDRKTGNIYLNDDRLMDFYKSLVLLDDQDYDEDKAKECFNYLKTRYFREDKINLFSSERFTTVFYSFCDLKAKAFRLKRLFPDARILFIIRNQFDIIRSQYRDHPFDPNDFSGGKPVNPDVWVNLEDEKKPFNFFDSINYYNVIRMYREIFGEGKVNVLPFEEIVTDLPSFSKKISGILSIDPGITEELLSGKRDNTGVSWKFNLARSLRRKLFPGRTIMDKLPAGLQKGLGNYLKKGTSHKVKFRGETEQRLIDIFARSNKLLSEEMNLDLRQYNYPGNP